MKEPTWAYADWEKFKRYGDENPEYKNKARELLCDSLGFEPPIHISMASEVTLRRILKKLDDGECGQETLDFQLNFQTRLLKRIVPEYAPNQSDTIQ